MPTGFQYWTKEAQDRWRVGHVIRLRARNLANWKNPAYRARMLKQLSANGVITSTKHRDIKIEQLAGAARRMARDPAIKKARSIRMTRYMKDPAFRKKALAASLRNIQNSHKSSHGPSWIAQRFFDMLRKYGVRNLKQEYPVGACHLDIVHLPSKTNIEIDGAMHRLSRQVAKDRRRDKFLRSQGWRVIRIKLRRGKYSLVDFRRMVKLLSPSVKRIQ